MKSDLPNTNFVRKRSMDPTTGVATSEYYWEGELALKAQINGVLPDKYSGYLLIRKDLDAALGWLEAAAALAVKSGTQTEGSHFQVTDSDTFDIVKAYFVAALTFYGKCFTEAAGRHAQVSRDWIDAEYRERHDFLMKYRHNYAAHSGDEVIEIAKTYVLVHPTKEEFIQHLPTTTLQPALIMFKPGESDFIDLIKHVIEKVSAKTEKLKRKIIFELVVPKGVAFWRNAANQNVPIALELPKRDGIR